MKLIFKSGKGHLLYLMEELIELLETKEDELKDKAQELLSIISSILNIK